MNKGMMAVKIADKAIEIKNTIFDPMCCTSIAPGISNKIFPQ